jgi:hypothetical protein
MYILARGVCAVFPERLHRLEGVKPLISLKEATLEQIVSELRSRSDLSFALIVLIATSEQNTGIFASQECDVFDVVRLLMAGAQDVMECFVDYFEEKKPKGRRRSERLALRKPTSLPSLSGHDPERQPHKKLRNYGKATEKAQDAPAGG